MPRPIAFYRPGFCLRNPRTSWPVLGLAIGWLGLTAILPLAFESGSAAPVTIQVSPEAQRERLQQFSEALMWPLGLAPLGATEQDSIEPGPVRPANCS